MHALIDLCSIPQMTQGRLRTLLVHFGSAGKVLSASRAELKAIKGIPPELAERIASYQRSQETEERIRQAESLNCQVISFLDPAYPANLRTIDQAPPVLFMRGRIIEADQQAIAIIGTRRATSYGIMVAQRFARGLAEQGITVVSGLARGIDTAAHIGALAGKGRTIAVLGCGVDVYYPPENRRLYDQIAEHGAVVSEFNFGTKPEAFHFPVRNRVISGLARAVLAVEARDSSGVLNTVRWAADQGREVLAVPGAIFAETSQGTNELIKDGARPVTSVADILELMGISGGPAPGNKPVELSAAEAEILKHLTEIPCHIDDLAYTLNCQVPELVGQLLELEIRGLVRQLPGMMFVRNHA